MDPEEFKKRFHERFGESLELFMRTVDGYEPEDKQQAVWVEQMAWISTCAIVAKSLGADAADFAAGCKESFEAVERNFAASTGMTLDQVIEGFKKGKQ